MHSHDGMQMHAGHCTAHSLSINGSAFLYRGPPLCSCRKDRRSRLRARTLLHTQTKPGEGVLHVQGQCRQRSFFVILGPRGEDAEHARRRTRGGSSTSATNTPASQGTSQNIKRQTNSSKRGQGQFGRRAGRDRRHGIEAFACCRHRHFAHYLDPLPHGHLQ